MKRCNILMLLMVWLISGCGNTDRQEQWRDTSRPEETGSVSNAVGDTLLVGGLLLTSYATLEDFKKEVQITYKVSPDDTTTRYKFRGVSLLHSVKGRTVQSDLIPGIREQDFVNARDGGLWDKARVAMMSPYVVFNRSHLVTIEILGRRRYRMFGEGDIAFYDLALAMTQRIVPEDTLRLANDDLGEKGFTNTFNHITAQVFMTLMYTERLADFVADVHERQTMPELVSGHFTSKQLADQKNGPVDNYVDMVNNEWGQQIGNFLKTKYRIDADSEWTPGMLSDILNEILIFQSRVFDIGFSPFRPTDEIVIRFSQKLNIVTRKVSDLQRNYY